MNLLLSILLCLSLFSLSSGFEVTSYSVSPDVSVLHPGESLLLLCKSSSDWERCKWVHRGEAESSTQYCAMEWKRSSDSVTLTDCPMEGRVRIAGNYTHKECGIRIPSIQTQDQGEWECHMEEYLFGDWSSGPTHSHLFNQLTDDLK